MERIVLANSIWLLLIISVFFILHIPLLSNPYHYDAVVFVSQSKSLLHNGLLSIPVEDYGHPYVLFWILAFFYNFFGENVIISHIVIFMFAVSTIITTYLIGKELFTERVAIVSSAFLAFQPWFFTVSGWVYLDIPLAAFFTASIYFFIKSIKTEKIKYFISFAIFGSLTALTKAPGILVILVPISYLLLKRNFRKQYFLFLIPIISLLIWYLWYYSQTGYFINPILGTKIFIPNSIENTLSLGKNFSTNIFFMFIQNGNFIGFLLITYVLFIKKYKNLFLVLGGLFFILASYSFELKEPGILFYPLIGIFNILAFIWIFKIFKVEDKQKILVIWIAVIMLHFFFKQISFRYSLPMLPAFVLLFASTVDKIKEKHIILGVVFSLLILQIFNYTNYYSQRDLIYNNIFDYFSDKKPQSVMVAYPIATPAVLSVEEIDSRPIKDINAILTPKTKEDFEKINPQYLVIDERTIEFDYPYIQEILKNKQPIIVYHKGINWYTYYGVRKAFINRLYIYKFY